MNSFDEDKEQRHQIDFREILLKVSQWRKIVFALESWWRQHKVEEWDVWCHLQQQATFVDSIKIWLSEEVCIIIQVLVPKGMECASNVHGCCIDVHELFQHVESKSFIESCWETNNIHILQEIDKVA